MTEADKLKDTYGLDSGRRVPVGYFDTVYREILDRLPAYPEAPKQNPLTRWQKVRPYVYLAAMFAGIWMMMNVFHHVSGVGEANIDNPPEQIAQLMQEQEAIDFNLPPAATFSDMAIEEDLSGEYSNMEDFQEDFGFELDPEYERIKL